MNVKGISTQLLTPLMFESKEKRKILAEDLPEESPQELPSGPVEKLIRH
jgi:hypothetical protein